MRQVLVDESSALEALSSSDELAQTTINLLTRIAGELWPYVLELDADEITATAELKEG